MASQLFIMNTTARKQGDVVTGVLSASFSMQRLHKALARSTAQHAVVIDDQPDTPVWEILTLPQHQRNKSSAARTLGQFHISQTGVLACAPHIYWRFFTDLLLTNSDKKYVGFVLLPKYMCTPSFSFGRFCSHHMEKNSVYIHASD